MKVLEKQAKRVILLGNEAIVRGALEAGVQFVTTYPGTPASEIGDTFYRIAKSKGQKAKSKADFYFEYSTNEKVALEAAIGASFSGLKSLCAMKHFGLNVCSDALMPFVYTGCVGPTVIVVGDDPSCHSSAQSEQNSRAYSYLAHIPTLEPADPQEAKDFTKLGFEISEKFKIPVMVRITTRVAHQRAPVTPGKINVTRNDLVTFEKDYRRFVTMPSRALEMKKELLEKIEKIREFSENNPTNYESKRIMNDLGIITSGISYLYVMEALEELTPHQGHGGGLPVLKLGFFYPLPEKKIRKFIRGLKKVLIVEELEPYLEKEIERLAKNVNPKLEIFGKNLLPQVGELKPVTVTEALAKFANKKFQLPFTHYSLPTGKRFPQLCPNCPYWLVFAGVKRALKESKIKKEDVIFGGDIGCYMLAGFPPHNLQDYLSCMGSSIGIGHGIKKASGQKLIAFIGDSTFFHAGIPALINIVHNQSNPLIIIMDNQTTAMTGQQPHPGIKTDALPQIKIENMVSACGVKNLKVIDPVNQKEFVKTIQDFLKKKQTSVIIARRPCIFVK